MSRLSALPVLLIFLATTGLTATAGNNRDFCAAGIAHLSDSLVKQLELDRLSALALEQTQKESRFAETMTNKLTNILTSSDVRIYLSGGEQDCSASRVEIGIDGEALTYGSINAGLFRMGQVVRCFQADAFGRLTGSDGYLVRTIELQGFMYCDTLSYNQAKLARSRGQGGFYSPRLPASLYQRVVEPALIVSITGGLIYLFFASR